MSFDAKSYQSHSDSSPGSFDGVLGKPLPDAIKADILTVQRGLLAIHIDSDSYGQTTMEAFNRLMTELYITTASSEEHSETAGHYFKEMNAIDKALDAAGILPGLTVDRVDAAIRRANDVEAAAPQALAAVRACAQVLSGDGMSKSLLVRALEMCRTVMRRANGEGNGLRS
jgi:hypothetical protein